MELLLAVIVAVAIAGTVLYMLSQRTPTNAQHLIQQGRFDEAVAEASRATERAPNDFSAWFHLAEGQKLSGRFAEALSSYEQSVRLSPKDPAAHEGRALTRAYLGDLESARRELEETIAAYPAIQEFQALALAWVLHRLGRVDESMRLFEDNAVLLETRFRDDYTDRDASLVETLFHYGVLSKAAGQRDRAESLFKQVIAWAPNSVFATWARADQNS